MFKKKIKHTTHWGLQISILVVLATIWFIGPALQELTTYTEVTEAVQRPMTRAPAATAPESSAAAAPIPILDTILTYAKSIGTLALVTVQIILGIQQYKLRKL